MVEIKKVAENYFLFKDDSNYIVQMLPFSIYKIEQIEKINECINELRKTNKYPNGIVEPQKYYLPLLIMTNMCNLRCTYCYAYEGSYGIKKDYISKEVIDASLNYHYSCLESIRNKDEIEVGIILFGGEPTLNEEMIIYSVKSFLQMVDKLNKIGKINYIPIITINTNAIYISDYLFEFLQKNKSHLHMIFSFDGIWHDKYRKGINNIDTMELTKANIHKFKNNGFIINITMVTPPDEMSRFTENIEFLIKEFGEDVNINPSFVRGAIPGVKSKSIYPGTLEQKYTSEIVEEWAKSVEKLILSGNNIYWQRFLNRIREGGYKYRCPAMTHEYCVTPNGNVYPCHNFTENEFLLGNITDKIFEIRKNKRIKKMFENRITSKLEPCRSCLFQTICLSSFDCPAHSLHDLGDFYKVDEKFCGASKTILTALLKRFISYNGNGK
jgi:uncharacterized protein